jgi:competence protein ComEA
LTGSGLTRLVYGDILPTVLRREKRGKKAGATSMQRVIIIIVAVMVSLPFIVKSRVSGKQSTPAVFSVLSSSKVVVRINGDVRHSGIYELSANTMTSSVINMALLDRAVKRLKPDGIGSHPVVNGADIHIKKMNDGTGMVTVGVMPASERIVLNVPLDINLMSEPDFERLPGVGTLMARRIVEFRQYNGGKMRVEELLEVEGIGEKKYNKIKKYF